MSRTEPVETLVRDRDAQRNIASDRLASQRISLRDWKATSGQCRDARAGLHTELGEQPDQVALGGGANAGHRTDRACGIQRGDLSAGEQVVRRDAERAAEPESVCTDGGVRSSSMREMCCEVTSAASARSCCLSRGLRASCVRGGRSSSHTHQTKRVHSSGAG